MIKSLIAASIISASLLGASVLPASAHIGAASCADAQRNVNAGVDPTGGGSYKPNAVALQACKAEGFGS